MSSYYNYHNSKYIKRETNKIILSEHIRTCFKANKEIYGSRRLSAELKTANIFVSTATVSKYMREMSLTCKFYPKFRNTTDSRHNNHIAENLLDREFIVNEPNKV